MAALVADFYKLENNCDSAAARVFLHQLPIAFAACTPTHPFALWLGQRTKAIRTFAKGFKTHTTEFVQALAICSALESSAHKRAVALQACADLV